MDADMLPYVVTISDKVRCTVTLESGTVLTAECETQPNGAEIARNMVRDQFLELYGRQEKP